MSQKHLEGYRESEISKIKNQQETEMCQELADGLIQKYLTGPAADQFAKWRIRGLTSSILFDGFNYTERRIKRETNPEYVAFFEKLQAHLLDRLGIPDKWYRNDGKFPKVKNWYWNGHFNYDPHMFYKSVEDIKQSFLKELFGITMSIDAGMPEEDLQELQKFMEDTSKPMDRWVPIQKKSILKICHNCGRELQVETDGHALRLVGPCEHPNGYPAYSVEVDFPTGEVVVTNDLRPWFREAWVRLQDSDHRLKSGVFPGDLDLNGTRGVHYTALEYSYDNYMTGYCGNTCPAVWRHPDHPNTLLIGNAPYCDANGDDLDDDHPILEGYEKLVGICTDLWWFSLADKAFIDNKEPLFRLYSEDMGGCYLGTDPTIIEKHPIVHLEPGRYRVTNHHHKVPDGCGELPKIYAVVERVGDCEGTYE